VLKMYDRILVRYGELSLKKDNRNQFVKLVNNHIIKALSKFPDIKIEISYMRLYIILNGTNHIDVMEVLNYIPGLHSYSLVKRCNSNILDIKETVLSLKESFIGKTIKVETSRALKTFPMTSLEVSKEVSKNIFKNVPDMKADVHNPQVVINIDLREEGTFIYTDTYKGLGGLPSKSLGKGLLMISGGIDSIVSGIEAIKRGMDIEAIHFSSPPYTSDMSLQKVIDLLEVALKYKSDQKIILHVVPFTTIQDTIYEYARDDYCVTIMRRMMYRIASEYLTKIKAKALINGENIGQVASQTLESLCVINSVCNVPVIRPLITLDKQEIIDKAIKYKTYDISIRPFDDCCTVFVPKHPQIKPKEENVLKQEAKFEYESLINEAIEKTETIVLTSSKHYDVLEAYDNL